MRPLAELTCPRAARVSGARRSAARTRAATARSAGLALEQPGAAVEQAYHMTFSYTQAVGEMVDYFVVDHRNPELFAQAARHVLPQRAHLARNGDDRHMPSPAIVR